MDTLGTEVGHGSGEQSDTLGKKAFSNTVFWDLLAEIKFWSLPAMWTSIQQVVLVIQQVACEKINGCNKMSCFQLEGKRANSEFTGLFI